MMAKQTSHPLKAALEHPSPMPKVNPHVQSNAKSSRVLTSAQNLKILNEKQQLKEQKIKLKEEKQRLRAEKARQKEEKQKDKSVQRRCTKKTIETEDTFTEEIDGEEIHVESDVDQSVFSDTVIEGDIEKEEDIGATTNLSEMKSIPETSGVMTRGRKALLTDGTERTVKIKGVAVGKKEVLSGKKGET
ncbi:PREDICTED: uncharacterized protein LOC100635747 isoform X3 [Amphimedon queenslandica]|uniref:Uncharacterized protein n=1 Tax=Amphimedon queenslandica TaxID=400682 RepID=A0A1X7TN41_AMPQE|nr:PREDICTED: uncharacterized protein LOC100635747 isoform X3 [Amphimedon queenslandica]XP_019858672.1 PREDICTED: uncharacterized protein LOC100635747 isoform X3 [Amphimedon queenslandica]|eukprot:XP_011407174.1 PREDICTED: uncharacterized protein LOC100635747 isoform X3 [Amphimedon queenslandica]